MDTNRKPPSAANALIAITVAPLNGADRKKRRSTRGSSRRGSYHSSPSRAAHATAPKGRTAPGAEPGAWMIAYVSEPNRAITSTWPTGSGRRALGARDSGTKRRVSSRAARPTGRLSQKIERQPTDSTSRPPTSGPAAMEMPTTAPHTPIARARSRGAVKVLVMIDMATGLSIEPPTAWTMRKTISRSRLGASEHSSEPIEKTTRPAMKTRLRPMRSAVEPASISSEASTSVYASIVHCRPEVTACSSRCIEGSATFSTVLSRLTMSRLMQQIASTSMRLRWLSSGMRTILWRFR